MEPPEARTVRVARDVDLPYPEPSSEAATKIGRANRRVDTLAERLLRSTLHRRGLRVQPVRGLPGDPGVDAAVGQRERLRS